MGGAWTRHRHAPRRHRHIQDPAAGHPPRSDERSRAGRTRSFVAAETFPGPAQAPHSTMLFIYIIPLVLLRPVGAMDPPGFLDGESGTGEVYGDSGAMGDAYYGDSGAGDSGAMDGPGFFAGAVDPALFLCSSTSEYLNEANECETCPLNAACDGMEATCDDKDQYVKDGACTSCPATFRCDGKVAKCDLDKFLDEAEQCADCPYGWVCNGVTKETCGDTMYINDGLSRGRRTFQAKGDDRSTMHATPANPLSPRADRSSSPEPTRWLEFPRAHQMARAPPSPPDGSSSPEPTRWLELP